MAKLCDEVEVVFHNDSSDSVSPTVTPLVQLWGFDMHIKTAGKAFELEVRRDTFFARIWGLGQVHVCKATGATWDSWSTLRGTGEA